MEGDSNSPSYFSNYIYDVSNNQYYSSNKINYNEIDYDIGLIDSQLDYINNIYKNLKFNVGNVVTNHNPLQSTYIGGNFPDNVKINLSLISPKRGDEGTSGIKGEYGIQGKKGNKGIRGLVGGNG